MNIKKAELRFKREWAKVTSGKAAPHVRVLPVAEEDQDKADLILQFDVLATSAIEAYVSATGCQSLGSMGMAMLVKVPAEWVAAPTRLMFAATGQERLHNALLDAGIADWLDIRLMTDQAALEVEFIEHPTAEQIAALKHDYDVLTFEELTYTFVERTAAPLVDPAKVEAKVRQCWAGGHGGKIATLEAQADPREFIVTTVKPVPANAQLRNHGLALVKQIAPEVSHVRITDDLWSKLLQKPAPAPETTATTEAAVVADTDTQPIPEPEFSGDLLLHLGEVYLRMGKDINIERTHPLVSEYDALTAAGVASKVELNGWLFYQLAAEGESLVKAMLAAGVTLSDSAAPPPELDERDLEINALKAQVDSLQHIIKSMTPLTNEWQTLTLKVKREGTGITAHPEIAEQEALGWRIHHVQYAPNGEDRLFVFMERRAKDEAPRYKWANAYAAQAFEPMNGNHSMTITPVSVRYQQEIDAMNDELTPSMNALAAAFGVDLGAWR